MDVTRRSRIIETETTRGIYDLKRTDMIVEHPTAGRLLLSEEFGGEHEVRGGMYRWEHGTAVKLLPGDTLESLREDEWGDGLTVYDAATSGFDGTRPLLHWAGHVIHRVATHAVEPSDG